MLARALNGNHNMQRLRILFITGIRLGILSRLDRDLIMELNVRGPSPTSELWTIVEENHHSFLIVEHNPLHHEGARNMAGHVAQALKQASREAPILLYAPALDRHLETMAELTDRVFCFYDMQGAGLSKGRSISEEMASQTTWGQKVRSPRIALGGKLIHAQ